ncbi:hypothetical protein Poly24_45980 [Rosistilla carotiformis]|uniref:Uncharacterized protein n=1 Tax=Rosistilla carotiformis TaxID=2528017 RepID=A0A518JZH1_9BACT|nr:hypothetical protein Poly24_45980 [Rosistilla carotiformis]
MIIPGRKHPRIDNRSNQQVGDRHYRSSEFLLPGDGKSHDPDGHRCENNIVIRVERPSRDSLIAKGTSDKETPDQ